MDGNLFSPDYTQGNLAEIDFIAQLLGRLSVIVISIVGFGIVIFTILKNAMHGLYAVSPKFWDRVDEAKKASLSVSGNNGGNQIQKVVGSISIVLLNLLPNVKAMTDFEDEQIDPKAYFMKSIPVACIQIFIGVFIFFGYPARVAEKFSDFGRNMIDVVLLNVDPVAWVEALPDKFLMLSLSTDGSKADTDVLTNKTAREAYNALVGTLSDMTKESRNTVSKEIESWVETSCTPTMNAYVSPDKYTSVVNARVTMTEPDISKVADKGDDKLHTFAFKMQVNDFKHGSAMDSASMWLRIDVTFTAKAQKNSNLTAVDAAMTMPASAKSSTTAKNETSVTIIVPGAMGNSQFSVSGTGATVKVGNGGTEKVTITVNGNVLTCTGTATAIKSFSAMTDIAGISGLNYKYNNATHPVREIRFVVGAKGTTFTPINSADVADWALGEGPVLKGEAAKPEASSNPQGSAVNNGNNAIGGGK